MAAEQGASLVPVAVLGEVSSLHNIADIPWMQTWSYKRLGYPVPYLVMGRQVCSPELPAASGRAADCLCCCADGAVHCHGRQASNSLWETLCTCRQACKTPSHAARCAGMLLLMQLLSQLQIAHGRCLQAFQEGLDAWHRQYYDAVEALFRKHMPTFPGYEDLELVMLR